MIDSINIAYRITPWEYKELSERFDCQTTIQRKEKAVWKKYFKNNLFNYTLKEKNELVNFDRLTVTGSIAKQLKGNNYENHRYNENDIKRFYEIIKDETELLLSEDKIAHISRFDSGINLNIETHAIIDQLKQLTASRYNKSIYDSSLIFKNKTRSFRIYDKIKECNEKDNLKLTGTVTRFESMLTKNRNISEHVQNVKDLLNLDKQKYIFYDTFNKIIPIDKIKKMKEKNTDKLTLAQYDELQALKFILNEFGDLETYRKHLLINMKYPKSSVSHSIRKKRELLRYLHKENIISLTSEIEREINKLQ